MNAKYYTEFWTLLQLEKQYSYLWYMDDIQLTEWTAGQPQPELQHHWKSKLKDAYPTSSEYFRCDLKTMNFNQVP